jgi:hypothetical protein
MKAFHIAATEPAFTSLKTPWKNGKNSEGSIPTPLNPSATNGKIIGKLKFKVGLMLQYVSKRDREMTLGAGSYSDEKSLKAQGISSGKLRQMFANQAGKCHWCGCEIAAARGRPNSATIEHLTPLSRGGSNKSHNLKAACASCNNRKADMTAEEFVRARRRHP